MQTYIVLLRGINVGGKNILKMDALKKALHKADYKNCTTYIQSGNIIFQSTIESHNIIEDQIKKLLLDTFNLEVPVLAVKLSKLQHLKISNPFVLKDTKDLYFTLLSKTPLPENLLKLSETKHKEDAFTLIEDIIYIHCPGGFGKTKFNNNYFENKLKTSATTRNWKTINKLIEMAEQVEN